MNVTEIRLAECVSAVSTVNPERAFGEGLFELCRPQCRQPCREADHWIASNFRVRCAKPCQAGTRSRRCSRLTVRPNLNAVARVEDDMDGAVRFHGFCVLRPGEHLDSNYLFHWVRAHCSCSAWRVQRLVPAIRRYPIALFEIRRIPFPDVKEQRRIARVLDAADALRVRRRSSMTLLDRLSEASFLDMFGDPVTNPTGWDEGAILSDHADVMGGITKGRKLKSSTVLRQVPYLAVSNVQDRRLDLSAVKTIYAAPDEIERYRLVPGDLLLTEGGDPDKLGRGTLWNGALRPCLHQNHIFRVRITNRNVLDAQS